MRPTQHPSNNDVLKAPPGVSIDECTPLAITRIVYQPTTMEGVRSYWMPTEQERKAIAEGAMVMFQCWGRTHPPVYLGVDGVEEDA